MEEREEFRQGWFQVWRCIHNGLSAVGSRFQAWSCGCWGWCCVGMRCAAHSSQPWQPAGDVPVTGLSSRAGPTGHTALQELWPRLCSQDILTDLSADCEDLTLEEVLENGFVHKVCAAWGSLYISSAVASYKHLGSVVKQKNILLVRWIAQIISVFGASKAAFWQCKVEFSILLSDLMSSLNAPKPF